KFVPGTALRTSKVSALVCAGGGGAGGGMTLSTSRSPSSNEARWPKRASGRHVILIVASLPVRATVIGITDEISGANAKTKRFVVLLKSSPGRMTSTATE